MGDDLVSIISGKCINIFYTLINLNRIKFQIFLVKRFYNAIFNCGIYKKKLKKIVMFLILQLIDL